MAKKLEQFQKIEDRYQELENLLASYETISDKEEYNRLAKELSDIKEAVFLFREYKKTQSEIKELESVLVKDKDDELLEIANKELKELTDKKTSLEGQLELLLKEEDADAGKNLIMEIRPGTGGLEAGLFAGDLYRMYTKYAARKSWTLEPMSSNATELGGFKEIIFGVKGRDSFRRLKFESGVHRVQRVPSTEAQGRIHTSTATVAVLVEPEEVDMAIEPKDLRIDTYRSSGPGGQHMQKTDSAVRITHLPSGIAVACQDERSQIKNKTKALRILRARLLDVKNAKESKRISDERKSQIGTGDRSEKIRTYNFPDHRVTDHRINFTSHRLEAVLEGDMDELSDALLEAARKKDE